MKSDKALTKDKDVLIPSIRSYRLDRLIVGEFAGNLEMS